MGLEEGKKTLPNKQKYNEINSKGVPALHFSTTVLYHRNEVALETVSGSYESNARSFALLGILE